MQFKAGQHIIAGLPGELNQREYSIYSGEKDDYLDILVREIPEGIVSVQLKQCKPGQFLQINGPFGSFGPEIFDVASGKLIFIATGTGISPFHSIVRSCPGIDYTLIHGVRYISEAYDRHEYDPERYTLCTSRESHEGRQGRITSLLSDYTVNPDMRFYVCGNANMIYEVFHIFRNKGILAENIFTEVYF